MVLIYLMWNLKKSKQRFNNYFFLLTPPPPSSPASTYEVNKYDAEKSWKEHQDRMKEIERR